MVPYRGRLALRIARLALAIACAGWYAYRVGIGANWVSALLLAYVAYAIEPVINVRFDTPLRSALAIIADSVYLALWIWIPQASWQAPLACAFLLAYAVLTQDLLRASITGAVALFIAIVLPPRSSPDLIWTIFALAAIGASVGVYKRYLEQRMSNTLRHNVIIRSQAQNAREAERQRIAADFHDGPLQSFISFQMRLEIIKKLMNRDIAAATEELKQLQELCQTQVTDLRSFVRSMRPPDEGMSLTASLSRMAELFQRDTGISATYSAGEIPDPSATEVSLEILQIVRESLNNVQKHSGASRVALSASRRDRRLEIAIEDNGIGLPFTGAFTLEELEMLRLGPTSIKRRVRMLGGELLLDSRPGQGAKLTVRVPL